MRRRGQSALIVVGAGIVVILLVLITYYLTELVVTNNDDIAKVETAIAITNQLSSKTDAYIKANAPIIALQLPAKLNVSLNQKYDVYTTFEVPFVYCELDVKNGYYSLQNEDVFDNADVRAMYLRKLYENISSSVFYNNGLATVFISGVPYRLINEELLPLFKTPYEYYYTEDKETINALFLTNHTNFIMLFPNISVQYNPDYVVCYADKRPDVMTFDECMSEDGTVIAPYLRMRNNHQLIVNTTLRPILGYNWLLLKYVAWRWAVNRTFEQKALVIPINYTNYYIFHTDPIATVIPKTLFDGKWHKLNLTDEITGKYEILGGQTSDTSEFGNINTDIYTLENRGIFHNGMRDLLNLITFYPAFPFTKSAHDSYYRPLFFYGANIMDFNKRNYLDVSPFIYPNNILYINKNSLYAQASAYTPDDYDNMLADLLAVSSYDFSRDTSLRDNAYFTSLYAMFRDDYVSKDEYLTQTLPFGVNYIQLLEIGIATNIYSLSNPFSLRLKSLSRFAGLGRPEDLNFLYNYTKRFDDYHLLTKSIPFYGAGISKDYSEELRGEAISISPSDFHGSDLIVDTYLMPLFIPYNDPDSAYGKLVNTKETLPKRTLEREPLNGLYFNEYTLSITEVNKLPLTSILGVPDRDKYFTLNDLGNFTSPEPEIKEIYFQLSEPKVYYYSYIPDDYQVVIDRVIVTADGQFDGIRDGDCTCTHKVWNGTNWTTETVTCPNFKRPSSVDGSGENDNSFKIRVAKSNGGTEFHRYKKIYAIGYHNFDNNDDSMEIRADGGSWIQLNTSWGKYDLGVTNGNLGSYVFARYSSGLLDDVGCNDTVGAYRWTAELVKYYVGVPQIYHVKAVMEFDMNLSVYGNLYAIDDNLIKDIIIKALKLDTLNPDSPDIKKALEQSIKLRYERGGSWQDFGLITYQNDTVGLFFTDDTTADVYKDHYYDYTFIVPPSLVFIPKLYQYIPFNLTIKNIHVTIVYEFDAGYPGRVKDGIPPYERERGKEYNWFDVTSLITLDEHKQIMNADDPDKEAKKIIWNFVKHFDDQFSQGGKAKLYILVNPTRDGGNYFPYDLQGYVEFIKISQVFKKT